MNCSKTEFGPMISKCLNSYVYALADPRSAERTFKDRIFYVGKGTGDRCFSHSRLSRAKAEQPLRENEHKLSRIRDIQAAGMNPEIKIVAHGLSDEEAFRIEAIFIELFGGTNRTSGHFAKNFWLSLSEIWETYDHPVERRDYPELRRNILFVSLNKQKVSELSEAGAMEQATLGDWSVGHERAMKTDYVIGVQDQLVVSIFEVHKHEDGRSQITRIEAKEKRKHARHRFHGKRCPDLETELVNRTIHQDGEVCSLMPRGAGYRFREALL